MIEIHLNLILFHREFLQIDTKVRKKCLFAIKGVSVSDELHDVLLTDSLIPVNVYHIEYEMKEGLVIQ